MTVIFCYRYENKHASQTPDTGGVDILGDKTLVMN